MRILIIGGGAAGATAAQFARKQNRDAEIIIFEATQYSQYSKCGLPYALSGKIVAFENLVEFSQEWFQRNKIELRLSTTVERIDSSRKTITIRGPSGTQDELYDALIFATGASPSVPPIVGIHSGDRLRDGVFQFRDMNQAKEFKDWCLKKSRNVVVIGAGLVGLECAEALHEMRRQVTVVEYLDSILPTMIDPDMTDQLLAIMSNVGIAVKISSSVEEVIGHPSIEGVMVTSRKDGKRDIVQCDTIILAAGQKPMTSLAQQVGCDLGKAGHIIVNDRCETTVKGIFAIGDCSQYRDAVTKTELPVGLGTLAVKMGEIAGKNVAGGDSRLPAGFLNARVTRLFGIEIAAVGPLSSALTTAGINTIQSRVKGSTLPDYYPGGKEITVKLSASTDDGKIISCQIVGEKESGLRIDVIAALMMGNLDVRSLSLLETAYAPSVAPCVDVLTTAAQAILIKLDRTKRE